MTYAFSSLFEQRTRSSPDKQQQVYSSNALDALLEQAVSNCSLDRLLASWEAKAAEQSTMAEREDVEDGGTDGGKDGEKVHKLLTIGLAGGGTVSCLLAHFPRAVLDSVEISPDSVALAHVWMGLRQGASVCAVYRLEASSAESTASLGREDGAEALGGASEAASTSTSTSTTSCRSSVIIADG